MFVAKEPDFDKLLPRKLVTFSIGKATSIDKLVEDLENLDALLGQVQLSLDSLPERTIECASEVIRVEGKEIFVDYKLLSCRSDFDCDKILEASADFD